MTAPAARTLTVVGTSRDRALPSSVQTVFASAALLPDAAATPDAGTYYVPTATHRLARSCSA